MKVNKLEKIKIKWNIHFYGEHILEAMFLDFLLEKIKHTGETKFYDESYDETQRDIDKSLSFLTTEGYIKNIDNYAYKINPKGQLLLANGGFTTEAKKNKNALFAFGISICAVIIALLSLFANIFYWFRNSI